MVSHFFSLFKWRLRSRRRRCCLRSLFSRTVRLNWTFKLSVLLQNNTKKTTRPGTISICLSQSKRNRVKQNQAAFEDFSRETEPHYRLTWPGPIYRHSALLWQYPAPFSWHGSIATHTTPSPRKPSWHVQLLAPGPVIVQTASWWHPPRLGLVHGLISLQNVPEPSYPALHWQLRSIMVKRSRLCSHLIWQLLRRHEDIPVSASVHT